MVILGLALLGAVALVATKPKATPVQVKEKAWRVSVRFAEPKSWAPTLTLYGRIESLWSSRLTSGVTADVLGVSVLEGDDVAKGQLLVTLDDRDAGLMLAQREAELSEIEAKIRSEQIRHQADIESLVREKRLLELSSAELKRVTDLVQRKLGSHSALDASRQDEQRQALTVRAREQSIQAHEARLAELTAKRHRAEALRDRAKLDKDRTRIASPFTGRIAKVLVSPGKRVRSGDAVIQLYDTSAMVVRSQLPSRYVGDVRRALDKGEALQVNGEIDGHPLKAKLLRIAGEAGAGSGGIEALFAIEQGRLFQQGRFVRIDLTLPEQPGLIALPPESIYGADRVYRVGDDDRMHPLTVKRVGEVRDEENRSLVLIASDNVKPGERIVATQLPNAIDGLLVEAPGKSGDDVVRIVPDTDRSVSGNAR